MRGPLKAVLGLEALLCDCSLVSLSVPLWTRAAEACGTVIISTHAGKLVTAIKSVYLAVKTN